MSKKIMMAAIVIANLFIMTGILFAANGDLIVNGNLGVGIQTPGEKVSVAGTIESKAGGFKFPDGSVQTTAAQTLTTLMPVGSLVMYGGSTAPEGWLLADGAAVSRITYATLFAVIGTTFGAGDGLTTFNLPDFRRRVGVGSGGTIVNASLGNVLGNTGGEEQHRLTISEMPSHAHGMPYNIGAGVNGGVHMYDNYNTAGYDATQQTGGNGYHNTFQPSLIVNYIIKM